MRPQAGHPVPPHRELHARSPAQAAARWPSSGLLAAGLVAAGLLAAGLLAAGLLIAGQCLDRDLAVEAG